MDKPPQRKGLGQPEVFRDSLDGILPAAQSIPSPEHDTPLQDLAGCEDPVPLQTGSKRSLW